MLSSSWTNDIKRKNIINKDHKLIAKYKEISNIEFYSNVKR